MELPQRRASAATLVAVCAMVALATVVIWGWLFQMAQDECMQDCNEGE